MNPTRWYRVPFVFEGRFSDFVRSHKPTDLILRNDQAAIDGIRAAGARQLILAPGNGFTGGHSWTQITGNGAAPSSDFMNQLVDPLRNTAIDIHEVCYYPLVPNANLLTRTLVVSR